jgi:hypothetical protein
MASGPLNAFVRSLEACSPLQLPVRDLTHIRICELEAVDTESLATICVLFPKLQELWLQKVLK